VWTGGGAAADCTNASGDLSKGIASLKYHAATGIYTLTFTDVGQQIVGDNIKVCGLTTVRPVLAKIIRGSFSRSAKTVDVEFYTCDTGALIDLLTTDKVMISVDMATVGPDS
jgi:hypothetical protein